MNQFLGVVQEADNYENRKLAEKPKFNIENLDDYTLEYNQYYTDNFSTRGNLINFMNHFEYNLFGVSASPNLVVAGKENWFYAKKSQPCYENAFLFSDESIEMIKNDMIKRVEWCAARGIKHYVVIVPNKMNVYPEYLPRTVFKKGDVSRYDQLTGLDTVEGLNIFGLKEELLSRKSKDQLLFQKTDDHWNDLGAYFGYFKILKELNADFKELEPHPLSHFRIQEKHDFGNMAQKIGMHEKYPERFVSLSPKFKTSANDGDEYGYKSDGRVSQGELEIVKTNEKASKLKCVIIRDSFTLGMVPFLQEHFSKMVLIHDEWRYRLRQDVLEIEKPDVVITIVLESHAHEMLANPSF
jgi:hypothetical protein